MNHMAYRKQHNFVIKKGQKVHTNLLVHILAFTFYLETRDASQYERVDRH